MVRSVGLVQVLVQQTSLLSLDIARRLIFFLDALASVLIVARGEFPKISRKIFHEKVRSSFRVFVTGFVAPNTDFCSPAGRQRICFGP